MFPIVVWVGAVAHYGHIHIAKTGGTTINTILAHRFSGVCGHKGFSETIDNVLKRMKKLDHMSESEKVSAVVHDMEGKISIQT